MKNIKKAWLMDTNHQLSKENLASIKGGQAAETVRSLVMEDGEGGIE